MIKLYNTLTRQKEEFKPKDPSSVGLYSCGPTVYDCAHIGNLRAFVFVDTLRRALEYSGYKVKHIMNITDIGHLSGDGDEGEDKMTKGLKREGLDVTLLGMKKLGEKYTEAFLENLKDMNILVPSQMPKASDNVDEMQELIKRLDEKGFVYRTSDGLYFDVSKFPNYGKLGNTSLEGQREGARVAVNSAKKNPADFSLWKFNDIGWDFKGYDKGFPGWHIECSAMSRKYLGQPFDIHTGGVDHIGTHHNGEIAQSEAGYGEPLANVWMHNEHLIYKAASSASGSSDEPKKMAKSAGNFITLRDVKNRGIHPLSLRYYFLQAHYRSPIEFSWDALEAAQTAYFKLLWKMNELMSSDKEDKINDLFVKNIENAIQDDFNTPRALSFVWTELRNPLSSSSLEKAVIESDKVLGLDLKVQAKELAKEQKNIPAKIRDLSAKREEARQNKDFKKADEIRAEIENAGYTIMDTDSGPLIRKDA
ncbi:MAG: cysteine--tRNA ligase [bacterium]|nr:cysteine--tRNA ligase [bacterium]